MKPTTPFGQLPTLDIDGLKVAQSMSILRYVGRKYGLYPRGEVNFARCDMIVEAAEDVASNVLYKLGGYSTLTPEQKEKLKNEDLPRWLGYFKVGCVSYVHMILHACVQNLLGEQEYFVENTFSFADIAIFCVFAELQARVPGGLNNFPTLASFVERVAQRPKIAAWIARRPQSEY